MSGQGSGGGLGMNKNVQPKYRTGAPNRAVRPGFAGQIGTSVGTHITGRRNESDYRGVGMKGGAAIASKLGNELAAQVKCGPGGSCEVMRSGQQAQHGSPAKGAGR